MAIASPVALNAADRLAVREVIVDRCTSHVANYALYLLGGTPTTGQRNWAQNAIKSAATVGESVSWHVINQSSFVNGGSSIEDSELQGIVETAINNHYIVEPAE